MRKLSVGWLASVDGVTADPQSWANRYFDEEAVQTSLARLEAADAMLMGRGTFEYFQPRWAGGGNPYLDRIEEMDKLVFSSTLTAADWNNATIVAGDAIEAVRQLKGEDGGELVVYGLGRFARSLLEHDLVDELGVWLHPLVLETPKGLRLVETERRSNGVVSLTFAPPGRPEASVIMSGERTEA